MSISQPIPHRYTVEDLYRPEFDGRRMEIWEGELVEMAPASRRHNRIAHRLSVIFERFCEQRRDLDFTSNGDGSVVSRADRETFFLPDAGLFRRGLGDDSALLSRSPDIAVEVASPSNRASEFARKRALYFAGGSEQVWILHPEERLAEIFHRDGTVRLVKEGPLVGEGIAAGLTIDLAELFKPLE